MRKSGLRFLALFSLIAAIAGAQQPQSQLAPVYAVNAKYANGVSPGYWPTAGSGLTLNLSAGTAYCSTAIVEAAAGTLTMANNTTNYVYLNISSSCAPASNTTGFTSTTIPIAKVTTASGAITAIDDVRTPFSTPSASGIGTVTSVALTMPSWFSVSGSPDTSSGTFAVTAATGQTSHQVIGTCGTATSFAPCALVSADLPTALQNGTTATTQSADDGSTKVATTAYADTYKIRSFGTTFGDTSASSALTSGSIVYFTVPYACTIQAWNISVDAGTATLDIWKIATGTANPTVSNTITASALPAISTGTAIHSTTLTGWTTSVSVNDIFGFQLKTVATAKYVEIDVQCNQ
jgi:hypothetical protein